jgi:hypothetical protein
LSFDAGDGLLEWDAIAIGEGLDGRLGEVAIGLEVVESGIGKEGRFEGFKKFAAQRGNPLQQEGDVAHTEDIAYPGIPEEYGLDLGEFGIGEDEGDPEGDMGKDGLPSHENPADALEVEDRLLEGGGLAHAGGAEAIVLALEQGDVLREPGDFADDEGGFIGEVGEVFGIVFAASPGGGECLQGFDGFGAIDCFGEAFGFCDPFEEAGDLFVAAAVVVGVEAIVIGSASFLITIVRTESGVYNAVGT